MKRTSPPARLAAALALCLLPALLAGCSPDSQVLARVGGRTITRADFMDVASRNPGAYPGRPETAKAALLDDLVKRQLLVLEARKRGLLDANEEKRLAEDTRDQLVLRTLFTRAVGRDIPVSAAEVDSFYRQLGSEVHLQIVFTLDRAGCDAALGEVRAGRDFGQVADRWNQAGMVPPHGDVGFVSAGALTSALDRVVVSGKVGQVAGPIESGGEGWFLVKVVERRARKQEPLAGQRDVLAEMIRQRKQRGLLLDLQRGLLDQYRVEVEPDAAQILFMRYNLPTDTTLAGSLRIPEPPTPTPEQARRALGRYDGADGKRLTYTLADAIRDLQDPMRPRPNFAAVPALRQWLFNMLLQRVARIEGQRRHFADEPDVARQVQQRVDNAWLESAYTTLVVTSTTLTDEELRAEYEREAAQVAARGTPVPPFDKLDEGSRNALRVQMLEQRRAARLDQLLKSLRVTYRPETYPERLARIPWPVPAAAQLPGM